jgi:DNA-binding NarL/FixJ family response regulator
MTDAVGVLIVGEPLGLEPAFRAVIEHEPRLQTLSEGDLASGSDGPSRKVALLFVGAEPEPGLAGRIAALKGRAPGLAVLVGFEVLRAGLLTRLVDAGADAFIARSATPRDICQALLSLAAGPAEPAWDAEIPAPADGLTPREAEILRFLSAGFSNKEVARRLNLSVRTVETHRLNLRRKTQTGRLKDLVALARHLGLTPVVDAAPVRSTGGDRPRGQHASESVARL